MRGGNAVEQRQSLIRPVQLDEDTGAAKIDDPVHCIVRHSGQKLFRSIVMLKRLLVSVEVKIDIAQIGFELSKLGRTRFRHMPPGRPRPPKGVVIPAEKLQGIYLLNLDFGAFYREPCRPDRLDAMFVKTVGL